MQAGTDEKPIVSFRIPRELKDALKELAEADRRSLSAYIQIALEKHVQDAQLEASE